MNKRAEGYVDTAVSILVVVLVIFFALSVVSLVTTKQEIKNIAYLLIDYATLRGDTDIDSYACELRKKTNIDFEYSFEDSTYRENSTTVQLGERIEVKVFVDYSFNGFGNSIHIIYLEANASGVSQVYWK